MSINPFLFKVLRADIYNYWNEYLDTLICGDKSELRHGNRKLFTTRLAQSGCYEVVPTKPNPDRRPLFDNIQRIGFTHRHSSHSYATSRYFPKPFGHSTKRAEELVGVLFDIKDVLLQRIMTYDGGTFKRPYDFDTKEEAEAFLKSAESAKKLHSNLQSLEETGIAKGESFHNEVMARTRWNTDGSSKIVYFTNNPESRKIACIRAVDLKKKLLDTGKCDEEYITPIVGYNKSAHSLDDYDINKRVEELLQIINMENLEKYLKDQKVGISAKDLQKEFVILESARSEFETIIASKEPISDVNLKRMVNLGYPVFHRCAELKNEDTVQSLIDRGMPINLVDHYGNTPLMLAVKAGNLEVTKFLLNQEEVDVKSKNNMEENIIIHAVQSNKLEMLQLVLNKLAHEVSDIISAPSNTYPGFYAIDIAAAENNVEFVKILLFHGASCHWVKPKQYHGNCKLYIDIAKTAENLRLYRTWDYYPGIKSWVGYLLDEPQLFTFFHNKGKSFLKLLLQNSALKNINEHNLESLKQAQNFVSDILKKLVEEDCSINIDGRNFDRSELPRKDGETTAKLLYLAQRLQKEIRLLEKPKIIINSLAKPRT